MTPTYPVPRCAAAGGAVASIDHLASSVGLALLRAGGSAADAAVGMNAVLAVTSQHLCGLGGDLLAVVVPPDGPPLALEGAGAAGSGADPDRLRAEGRTEMPFRGDIRSVTVPGCVDGWLALHGRFGRLPLGEVLAPAVAYAASGFPASPTLALSARVVAGLPEAADYPAGLRAGDMVRRPGVARTLRAIVAEGRDGFYRGEFGEGLVALGAGEHTVEDLARPQARWNAAVGLDVWGQRLWTVGPPSQGYLTLAGAAITDGLDLPTDPADPRWAHLLIESARQAGHDRLTALADGADPAALLDPALLADRRARVSTTGVADLGDRYRDGDTTALCVVDADRLGVAVVQSNASGFGSHLIVPGVRIFLHNRGIGFNLTPGSPGEYGPGRRPVHTLCPTAVTDGGGNLVAVAGTMGGDGQPQILLQVLARHLLAGEDPADAVAAGRWVLRAEQPGTGFDTWGAGGRVVVQVEGHAPPSWAGGLTAFGHRVEQTEAYSGAFGHAHLIAVDRASDRPGSGSPGSGSPGSGSGVLRAGTDPRPRGGAALGY
jgi:gamma-glutamyltranspeptidase/glutathione hydrolase